MIKTKQIVIDGLLSTYTEDGEGSPVVLLHGWGCRAGTFKDVQTELAKSHKVFAVDFPGFGSSDEPDEVWGIEAYADWTQKLISKLGIVDPIILGHSFGGRVALILNTKTKIRKLILTGGAGLILDSDVEFRKKNEGIKKAKGFFEKILPKSTFEKVKDKMVDMMGSADYKAASPKMREVLKRILHEDLKEYAIKIQVPTLLVWGENDTATPVAMAKAFHEYIKGSQLNVLPDAGHYVFIDKKEQFLDLVKNFLKV
jgi:pimeloyl-ACP methyl ester carboxylesterase